MKVNQQMVSPPTPYSLVSTTSDTNGAETAPANGAPKPNGAARPPVVAAGNGRPVTRKTAPPATTAKPTPIANGRSQNGSGKQNGNSPQSQVLLYGDGTPVAAGNQTERSTYARYQQAKGTVPPSKQALQQFYQQQVVG